MRFCHPPFPPVWRSLVVVSSDFRKLLNLNFDVGASCYEAPVVFPFRDRIAIPCRRLIALLEVRQESLSQANLARMAQVPGLTANLSRRFRMIVAQMVTNLGAFNSVGSLKIGAPTHRDRNNLPEIDAKAIGETLARHSRGRVACRETGLALSWHFLGMLGKCEVFRASKTSQRASFLPESQHERRY